MDPATHTQSEGAAEAPRTHALASRTFLHTPFQTQPRTYQHLPRDFTGLDVKRAAAMKIVRIQQSAVHVGATAYLAREERAVDAARLLVVVNGGIKDLASGQTRSATRTQHTHAAASEHRLPSAVPASRGLAGAARSSRCGTCACAALATLMLRPSAAAAAMLGPQANQDPRGSTAPAMILLWAATPPRILRASFLRVVPGPANCRALLPNDCSKVLTFIVIFPCAGTATSRPRTVCFLKT